MTDEPWCPQGLWRNGSASDSRSEGWEFESLWPHVWYSPIETWHASAQRQSFALLAACVSVCCAPPTISPVCSAMGRATTQRFKIEAHHDKQFRTKVIATAGREVICRHPQSCVQFVSPLLSCFLEGFLAHLFFLWGGGGWRGFARDPFPQLGSFSDKASNAFPGWCQQFMPASPKCQMASTGGLGYM